VAVALSDFVYEGQLDDNSTVDLNSDYPLEKRYHFVQKRVKLQQADNQEYGARVHLIPDRKLH